MWNGEEVYGHDPQKRGGVVEGTLTKNGGLQGQGQVEWTPLTAIFTVIFMPVRGNAKINSAL